MSLVESPIGMLRSLATALGALIVAAVGVPSAPALAQGVRAGLLSCNVSSGFGFIVGSLRSVNCVFSTMGGAYQQHYGGSISRYGIDLGYIQGGVMVWTVLATVNRPTPCALAGTYAGPSANATVGIGLGANVLFGGSNNSIALQPLSLEGNTGFDVAGGITAMSLTCQP
jgi:Protein of unknown function (DUF992)